MRLLAPSLLFALGLAACADETGPSPRVEPKNDTDISADERPAIELSLASLHAARSALSGGALTVFDASADAFSLPAPNLVGARLAQHDEGDVAFDVVFDAAPGSTNPGLGSVFNNVSCESCHLGNGRGRPPAPGEQIESILFRASVPGLGPHGGQLQLPSVGILPDASAVIQYVESHGVFSDGSPFQLRVPTYTLTGVRQGLPAGTLVSPRVAPAVVGLGLLEAVPEAEVLAIAIAQAVGRRVSGRPNYVWDEVRQRLTLGRFGWKANNPSLVQQTACAYNGDMGITTSLFPATPCEGADPACARHSPELRDQTVADVAFYTRTLGVPARSNLNNPVAQQGELLFHQAGCASCHVATMRTGVLAGVPEVSN
jgi:CxxC motif-containing protein (DUF1111 family)